MLRSVDHWELPTWTWANSFTLLFASAQENKRNYVCYSRAVVLPQLEHWGKAWRPQMKSSTAAPAYKIKKRICDPQLQPLSRPCSQHRAEVSGWSGYTKKDFGSSKSCMNQSCETKQPSAAFKPHCGRESIFDKHFVKDRNWKGKTFKNIS